MKNSQKGFVAPLIIVFALVVGAGAYIYSQNKSTVTPGSSGNENVSNTTKATVPSPSASISPLRSDEDAIIQAILNAKDILSSGDAGKIRVYLQMEYADNPKFAAQAKSSDDKTLLATAALLSKAMTGIDEAFLRTKCKITITDNTAKCSWNPTNDVNLTQSVSVKKINGLWR